MSEPQKAAESAADWTPELTQAFDRLLWRARGTSSPLSLTPETYPGAGWAASLGTVATWAFGRWQDAVLNLDMLTSGIAPAAPPATPPGRKDEGG